MKSSSWDECVEDSASVKISPDKAKARSLIETAEARLSFLRGNQLSELNARFIFEGYYSSVVEVVHALVILDGFKVDNHICLGYYLRDAMKWADLFRVFDDCRYKRNSVVYYGQSMDFDVARDSIARLSGLFKEIKRVVEARLGKI